MKYNTTQHNTTQHNTTQHILLAVAAIVFFSCGTIMHGTSQKIGVSSSPTGAKVWVDNKEFGVTPLFAELKRGDNHIVRLELANYQTTELTITKSVSGWVWGNIVFGGLIGLVVDAVSGGLYNLSPEQLNAELNKSDSAALIKDGDLYVLTVLKPDPNWVKVGNLEPINN